ncbi:MAG: type II secretion system F family protein [Eubacteriales bacterium]|nr:type II secretion system F family protein [Bacillota bacterium]MDQ7788491.1 type II secretion system F family protein [Clostridia bacterium]MDZ4043173.1 type II secretion system F family protein [Eubacteriales bacterium]MDZ7610515.1 type II secretion system F family protein [Eubacteriales bacterium]
MACVYRYSGRDWHGGPVRGTVTAGNKSEAVELLVRRQIWVIDIGPRRTLKTRFRNRTSALELATFCHQMSALVQAGVSPRGAIRVLAREGTRPDLRRTLQEVLVQLDEGVSLSVAFASHPRVFSGPFSSIVEAGEFTGQLVTALNRLAGHYERDAEINSRVLQALAYPTLVSFVAAAVLIALFTFVLPTFHNMFSTLNADVPASTAAVFAVSLFVQQHTVLLIGIMTTILTAVTIAYWNHKPSRLILDRLFLRIPVIGSLALHSAVSRICDTLSGLIASGVPIISALEIVERLTGNQALTPVLVRARSEVSEGRPLANAFKTERLIPGIVSEMLAVGEATGALDSLLGRVACYANQEADRQVARITTILQPTLLVGVSGVVALILFAVLIPMFDMIWSIY